MLFCLSAICKLCRLQFFYLLCLLHCLCSFACVLCASSSCSSSYLCKVWLCESVLIEPAFSGFYLPGASKLNLIPAWVAGSVWKLSVKSANKSLPAAAIKNIPPWDIKVGHFDFFTSSIQWKTNAQLVIHYRKSVAMTCFVYRVIWKIISGFKKSKMT